MKFRTLGLSALAAALLLVTHVAISADKEQTKDQVQQRDQDRIYGSQLMTEQERIEHRTKMRSLKTAEEREAYLKEHHKKMQERAKEKGVKLPDEPPMRGGMMGGPGGMGPGGMGPGGGMGPQR